MRFGRELDVDIVIGIINLRKNNKLTTDKRRFANEESSLR
ncbi:MAG: hypothetical protein ACI9FR_001752 [Cryomorphaceae bacterium]|jgi:hypothetical protein